MRTYFTSFISGVTLSVLIANPVFAQTPADTSGAQDSRDLVTSCRDLHVPTYQSTLDGIVLAMQSSLVNEWKHQVGFRLKAARPARRALTERALAQAGTQLDAAIAQFAKTQTDSFTQDINVAVDSYIRLDNQAEQDALARWSDRDVSFQTLNNALARAERSLRAYASARDRVVLSSVWNATRKQAEESFTQNRDAARQQFVQDMDDCVAGVATDTSSDAPASVMDSSTDNANNSNATIAKKDTPPAQQTSFAVTGISVDTASDYASTCSPKITARVRIQANGAGRTAGYFVYQDGTTSPETVVDTDANGGAYAQDQRVFSASSAAASAGWVKYVVTRPNSSVSDRAGFKIECQSNPNQQPVNTPDTSKKDVTGSTTQGVQVLEAQLARSGSGPILSCGEQTIQYTGYVRLSQPGASFTYHFERSDAVRTTDQVATVNALGAANVFYNWTVSQPMYGWVKLVITSPAFPNTPSMMTDFTYTTGANCATPSTTKQDANTIPTSSAVTPQITATASVVGKQDASVCGGYRFQFQGMMSVNSPSTVSYRWERSDGVMSPAQTLIVDKAGTYATSEFWDLGSANYAGWARLHVLSPSDISSDSVKFTLVQACK